MFAVLLTTATFLLIVSQNTSAKVNSLDNNRRVQGVCYIDWPVNETLSNLEVIITGPNGPFFGRTNAFGHYEIANQNLQFDVEYTITAQEDDWQYNGGWKGTATFTVPCEDPPCTFDVTKNIICHYYENPN
jgi:hypothetical protein